MGIVYDVRMQGKTQQKDHKLSDDRYKNLMRVEKRVRLNCSTETHQKQKKREKNKRMKSLVTPLHHLITIFKLIALS